MLCITKSVDVVLVQESTSFCKVRILLDLGASSRKPEFSTMFVGLLTHIGQYRFRNRPRILLGLRLGRKNPHIQNIPIMRTLLPSRYRDLLGNSILRRFA